MTKADTHHSEDERFFFFYGLSMLVFIAVAFAGVALFKPEVLPPRSAVIVVHAVVMFGWFSLFVMQTHLIGRGNVRLHQRLGKASVVLAIAVVTTGILVMLSAFARRGVGQVAMLNTLAIVTFVIMYAAAIRTRRSPEYHKRLMLLGSVRMLPPAFTRMCLLLGVGQIWMLGMLGVSVLALIVYDWKRLGRVHPATIIGAVLIFAPLPLAITVGASEEWADLLRSMSSFVFGS